MSDAEKFELLKELTRLLKKFGPDVFAELSEFLKDGDFVDELAATLDTLAKSGKKVGVTKVHRKTPRPGQRLITMLADIEKAAPRKAKELSDFVGAYRAKRVLPTLRHVRDFASDNGLGSIVAPSREMALFALVKELQARPSAELSAILRRVAAREHEGDRTLEGWAGVILDRKHRDN